MDDKYDFTLPGIFSLYLVKFKNFDEQGLLCITRTVAGFHVYHDWSKSKFQAIVVIHKCL